METILKGTISQNADLERRRREGPAKKSERELSQRQKRECLREAWRERQQEELRGAARGCRGLQGAEGHVLSFSLAEAD